MIAAVEQFLRDTAPPRASVPERPDPWAHAALLEAVRRHAESPAAWGDPQL